MPGSNPTESMNLRVAPDLKQQVRSYADAHDMSVNAAVADLLTYAFAEKAARARARETERLAHPA
jgi:predicted HicB family RNase H-like nuclease